ncbi:carboxylate-amine ligase [Asanoa siamensis]|uniref:Putative glutamate--cysteine ligase 2 n=1 Tax=Asanoa siamensis TaxID=926357 RepID=A0ABQ4CTF1_9ACTN|nr:glutamate--cysteine ligase [Asanoa siamensis]GIF74569.1 putative glutamate--cysteine ligase 2-3 [Asanoa siamensis]
MSNVVEQSAEPDTGASVLTVGVEEEFLLVDPETGAAAEAVEAVLGEVPPDLRGQVQHEFLTSQIEIGSPPGLHLEALSHSLGLLRGGLSEAAERAGYRLLAVGTGPAGPDGERSPRIVDNPRFHRMIERYGNVSPGPGYNGMHVHVGIPGPDIGVEVLNHLRPWLPVLHAATANSPFYNGRDTGYASWRSVLWNRWPPVGPTPWLESHAHYQTLVDELIDSGMLLDEGMLYWYARLSSHLPTVEIRIGDVCLTIDDTILIAALIRGLVSAALDDIEAGRPALRIDHHLLVAAHWRAAHDGLEGLACDLFDGGTHPAWQLMRRLFERVGPHLERHGDLETVGYLLGRLHTHGTGAARQRSVFNRTGEMSQVIDYLTVQTRG